MRIIKASRGTVNEFVNAIEDRIAELQDDGIVDTSSSVHMAADDIDIAYLKELKAAVRNNLSNEVASIQFKKTPTNLVILYTYMGEPLESSVPLSDLSMKDVVEDASYISTSVVASLDQFVEDVPEVSPEYLRKLEDGVYDLVKYEVTLKPFRADSDGVHVTVDDTVTFDFNYAELSLDESDISKDVDYIANTILRYVNS